MKWRWLTAAMTVASCLPVRATEVLHDDFQTFGSPWSLYTGNRWGPRRLETWPHEVNHSPDCVNPPGCDPRGETTPICPCAAARQYEHSDNWCSWERTITAPDNRSVRYGVWFLDLLYRTNPNEIIFSHFQVQGWITLLDASELDACMLGIHAHWTNPLANWLNYSWATASDGWHVTSMPRQQGWRHFEIVVHPYTGLVGDVEFFIDGQKVGEGRRLDIDGQVFPPRTVRMGADPAFMGEDYVANTYQNTFYDDAQVFVQDTGDLDFDGDVDGADYGIFAGCFNGTGNPISAGCRAADLDGDGDVDGADYGIFAGCFNGTGNPPPTGCRA